MAEVFRGKSISMEGFERLVAIKRVLPSLIENKKFLGMFLDEAKLSLALNHANIVQVFDLGSSGETYFIVMEFIEGANLKTIVDAVAARGQRFDVAEAVYIMIEVCKGLAYAHQKRDLQGRHLNIVHRDISPPNILVSASGEVKITDFGLAKAQSQVEVTDPGIVKGKFSYLSPEGASGEEVDSLTDIFATGIVLWEMLASRRLFLGESDVKTIERVRQCNIPSLPPINPEVPPELDKIVAKALAVDKRKRYKSARELGRDLSEFLFSRGMRVTSFDVSNLVRRVVRDAQGGAVVSAAVNDLVQEEINKIIRVEQEGTGEEEAVKESGPVATVMEDPREWGGMWDELGMDGDGFAEPTEGSLFGLPDTEPSNDAKDSADDAEILAPDTAIPPAVPESVSLSSADTAGNTPNPPQPALLDDDEVPAPIQAEQKASATGQPKPMVKRLIIGGLAAIVVLGALLAFLLTR